MASFATTNASSNLVGRELSIASTFVKQYYTLLNKAPRFIHNFYSHDSTFIHGTIEMADEHYTEPIVGREKIRRKVEELKLNDCRAKIEQIDCLETLAGGLVIQVIGELSNNGKPMRRFLQTFVLAPSLEDSRQDGDSQQLRTSSRERGRGGVSLNESNSSSSNQKFFVLNSIFRYQDDGHVNEFDDDAASLNTSAPIDSANGGLIKTDKVGSKQVHGSLPISNSNGSEQSKKKAADPTTKDTDETERLAKVNEETVKLNRSNNEACEFKRDIGNSKAVSNGTRMTDKKNDVSEKSAENGSPADGLQSATTQSGSSSAVASQSVATASRPQPSSEPKTWANMVRNANPQSTSVQSGPKPATIDQNQNVNQSSSVQAHSQLQQNQTQQPHQLQQQIGPQTNSSGNLSTNTNIAANNININRRRHMVRKPPNKSSAGRPMKNRLPRPPAPVVGKPMV